MLPRIDQQLGALRPAVSTTLVGDSSWHRLHGLAARHPPAWSWGVLECRLTADPRVDFMVGGNRGVGQQVLAQRAGESELGAALGTAHPFLSAWSGGDSLLSAHVPVVWLEYDLLDDRIAPPFMFVCVDPWYMERQDPPSAQPILSADELRALSARVLAYAERGRAYTDALRCLERCASLLPQAGRFLHIASLAARGRSAELRVGASLDANRVHSWLQAIGWPGRRAQIERGLSFAGSGFARPAIQLELGRHVHPYLAFEYYSRSDPAAGRGWAELFERLIAARACRPDKAEAALAFVGRQSQLLEGSAWPVQIQRQLFVKVIPHADGTLEAKAYLCFHGRYVLWIESSQVSGPQHGRAVDVGVA